MRIIVAVSSMLVMSCSANLAFAPVRSASGVPAFQPDEILKVKRTSGTASRVRVSNIDGGVVVLDLGFELLAMASLRGDGGVPSFRELFEGYSELKDEEAVIRPLRLLRGGTEVLGVPNDDGGVVLLGLDLMRTGDVIPLAEAQVGADYLTALRSKASELSALARAEIITVAGQPYEVVTLADAGLALSNDGGVLNLDPNVVHELVEKNRQIAAQKSEAANNEGALAQLSSNRLIASGLTGGLGMSVLTPGPAVSGNALQVADLAVLPHVIFAPGFLALRAPARAYCAASFTSFDEDVASRAAFDMERQRAKRLLEAIAAYGRTLSDETLPQVFVKQNDEMSRAILENPALRAMVINYANAGTKDPRAAEAIVTALAHQAWNPTQPANCAGTRFGIWAGIPVALNIRSRISALEPVDTARSYKPIVSFGVAWVPAAVISFLAGITYGNLWVGETETAKGTPYAAWAWTLGIGGTLDILNALTKSSTPQK